jgi:hypothetical protein
MDITCPPHRLQIFFYWFTYFHTMLACLKRVLFANSKALTRSFRNELTLPNYTRPWHSPGMVACKYVMGPPTELVGLARGRRRGHYETN